MAENIENVVIKVMEINEDIIIPENAIISEQSVDKTGNSEKVVGMKRPIIHFNRKQFRCVCLSVWISKTA